MTQAGWYPDPAGQPQTYRYWDGSSWSQETTGDPYGPPPAPAAPAAPPPPPATVFAPSATPPASYGNVPAPPAFGGFPPAPPSGGSSRSGLTILLVVVAVLVFVGLSVGGFVAYRALSDDDGDNEAGDDTSETVGPTDATTEPTGSPTDVTTDVTTPTDTTTTDDGTGTTELQCTGGSPAPSETPGPDAERVSSGGVSIPVPDGYEADTRYSADFTWADDFTPVQKVIEEGQNTGWVSVYGVGTLRKANGFEGLADAADVVMACMAASPDLYSGFSGRTDLSSGPITVDGNDAYQVTSELRIDNPELEVEGDVAQVIVIDMGSADTYGLYLTVVPIGDQRLIRQQRAFVDKITAD